MLRELFFRLKGAPAATGQAAGVSFSNAAGPEGLRLYAIGDVHGRADLLEVLIGRIRDEIAREPPASSRLVFLGDFVDRGLESRRVVEQVIRLQDEFDEVVSLMGNHEEAMLAFCERPLENTDWLQFGGLETLLSYGVQPARGPRNRKSLEFLAEALAEAVPEHHWQFLENLAEAHEAGDFYFAHAGIEPSRPLHRQDPVQTRWMREPFLSTDALFEKVIVHGHTIVPDIDIRPNRVNLDTGAYHSGRLSALVIDGPNKTTLQVGQAKLCP